MITVITPTIEGRGDLFAECVASVRAAGLPHLIELDDTHAGPAAVRNRLLERVRTPWVLPLDDDDLLYPQYPTLVKPHLRPGVDVLYTAWELTGADDPKPKPGPFDADALRRSNFIPVTACIRARALRQVGGYPVDADLEDHALWVRLLDAGYQFRYLPIVAWTYRRQPGSRTETVSG